MILIRQRLNLLNCYIRTMQALFQPVDDAKNGMAESMFCIGAFIMNCAVKLISRVFTITGKLAGLMGFWHEDQLQSGSGREERAYFRERGSAAQEERGQGYVDVQRMFVLQTAVVSGGKPWRGNENRPLSWKGIPTYVWDSRKGGYENDMEDIETIETNAFR